MKRIRYIIAILLFLAGVCILLWPKIQGTRIERSEREAVQSFWEISQGDEPWNDMDEVPFADLYRDMVLYNQTIYAQHQIDLKDPWSCEQELFDLTAYGLEDGIVGVLDIPSCAIQMPIYIGASDEHLLMGACVISNTSMPIGGMNTNCVIAGHRSMYSATMFRHLDMIQRGDPVYVTNLWNRLEYSVSDIRVIEPSDVGEILIQDGHDMLTLITCHPYGGGGRQRLVVYCERSVDSGNA